MLHNRSNLALLPDALFVLDGVDLTVRELSWNDAWGHTRDALIGQPLAQLVPGVTVELFTRALQGTHDPHPDVPLRLSVLSKDGARCPVDIAVARADDGTAILASFRRVSDSARTAEREFVTVFAAAPEAIVTWNPGDGRIVAWNPAAERLFGVGPCAAVTERIDMLVPVAARTEFDVTVAAVVADGVTRRREVFRLRQTAGVEQEIEVEESIFVMRDVAQNVVRVGSFTRDLSEVSRLRRAAEALSGTATTRGRPLGISPAMREVEAAVDAAATHEATILLLGETGVGKTVLARRIHASSPRAKMMFLAVNCAALEPQLAESELFGHERGAFTGATHQKRGLVEAAHGGTLLLDEVAELTLPVQAKLLTFLDTRDFRRVGALRNMTADVRVLAATNTHLEHAVERGAFRADLYYRLRVMPIHIPPLRERKEDLPLFVKELLLELRAPHATLDADVLHAIGAHAWPGNLRELKNALERALLLSRGAVVRLEHLPPEVRAAPALAQQQQERATPERLGDLEHKHILEVLTRQGGHRSRAAEALGISRSTLNRKLELLGVAKVRPRRA